MEHCREDKVSQKLDIFRMEDVNDLKKYKIKNIENGIDRPFDMIMTKDKKCLHKENGEISIRDCNNIKNQYWDYSSVTGPCKLKN